MSKQLLDQAMCKPPSGRVSRAGWNHEMRRVSVCVPACQCPHRQGIGSSGLLPPREVSESWMGFLFPSHHSWGYAAGKRGRQRRRGVLVWAGRTEAVGITQCEKPHEGHARESWSGMSSLFCLPYQTGFVTKGSSTALALSPWLLACVSPCHSDSLVPAERDEAAGIPHLPGHTCGGTGAPRPRTGLALAALEENLRQGVPPRGRGILRQVEVAWGADMVGAAPA